MSITLKQPGSTSDGRRLDTLLEGVMNAIRSMNGGLIVLAGNVWGLSEARQVLELAKKKMQDEGLQFSDIVNEPTLVDGSCSLVVFSELRDQDDPEHSTQLATRYLAAGATVLAIVHGTNFEGIQNRLIKLGMPNEMAVSVKVVDIIVV